MVTKEIQTKKKTSIWKKDTRRRKTLLTKTHFSGETMIQRKKSREINCFTFNNKRERNFLNGMEFIDWIIVVVKHWGEAVCFSELNSKLNFWIILPAFLNGIPTREDVASQFFKNSDRIFMLEKQRASPIDLASSKRN